MDSFKRNRDVIKALIHNPSSHHDKHVARDLHVMVTKCLQLFEGKELPQRCHFYPLHSYLQMHASIYTRTYNETSMNTGIILLKVVHVEIHFYIHFSKYIFLST